MVDWRAMKLDDIAEKYLRLYYDAVYCTGSFTKYEATIQLKRKLNFDLKTMIEYRDKNDK